jgi:hypothetical protein
MPTFSLLDMDGGGGKSDCVVHALAPLGQGLDTGFGPPEGPKALPFSEYDRDPIIRCPISAVPLTSLRTFFPKLDNACFHGVCIVDIRFAVDCSVLQHEIHSEEVFRLQPS